MTSCACRPGCVGGVRAGRKVAAWIKDKTGRQVHPQRGGEDIRRLGGPVRVPRPRHAKADQAEQEALKKTPGGARAGPASRARGDGGPVGV
jgi:Winged helix-turn helix